MSLCYIYMFKIRRLAVTSCLCTRCWAFGPEQHTQSCTGPCDPPKSAENALWCCCLSSVKFMREPIQAVCRFAYRSAWNVRIIQSCMMLLSVLCQGVRAPRAESIAWQRVRRRQLVLSDVNSETPVAAALACDTSVAIYRS